MAGSQLEISTELGVLDLIAGAEQDFFITRQIFDLNSFETRNSDFTKNITIPGTPRNIAILNLATDIASDSVSNSVKIKCVIKINGITVAPVAWMIPSSNTVTRDASLFDIVLFYGNFNIIDELSGRLISDLNWADTHKQWNETILVPASENTYLDNDIVFPVADWETRGSQSWYGFSLPPFNNTLDCNYMGFFLYARNIIERSLDAIGYSLIVNPDVPAQFNLMALACPVDMFIDPLEVNAQNPIVSYVSTNSYQSAEGVIVKPVFLNILQDPDGVWSVPTNEFIIPPAIIQDVYVFIDGFYDHKKGNSNPPASTISILQNGSVIAQISMTQNQTSIPFFISATVSAVGGDVFHVELEGGDGGGSKLSKVSIYTATGFKIATAGYDLDRKVITAQWIPEIKQSTFFANLLKLYNLFLVTDDIAHTVTLSSFDSLYTNAEIDLTEFLSTGNEEIKVDYSLNSLARSSNFKWGSDDLLRNDINTVVNFRGALLVDNRDIVTMDFSACDNSILYFSIGGGDTQPKAKLPLAEFKKERSLSSITIETDGAYLIVLGGGESAPSLNIGDFMEVGATPVFYRVTALGVDNLSGFVQTPVVDPSVLQFIGNFYTISAATFDERLVVIDIDGGEATYKLQQGSPVNVLNFTALSQTATWPDSLKMSNVVDNQYKRLLQSLASQRVIRAKFNLSAIQVLNFDFTRPVYIQEFNGFYYVNRIDQYKADNLTTLELIRLSTTTEL